MDFKKNSIRVCMLIFGIVIMALGVALSIKGQLGTTPIACVPYVISLAFTFLTVGEWTIIFNALLVVFQFIILKWDFDFRQVSQVLIVIVFGYAIDFWLWMLRFLNPNDYISQWILCLLGCFVLAFGVVFEIKSNLIVLPGDGAVQAICTVLDREFGLTKPYFDCSMVILGALLSFIFLGYLAGIREGTIVAAIIIGYIVKFYKDFFGHKIDKFLTKLS